MEALGRPTAQPPDDDSTVRRRVDVLRREKLNGSSNLQELAGAAVRIEVPKGGGLRSEV